MGTNVSKSNRDYNDLNQVDDDDFEGCRRIVLLGSKAGRSTFSRIFSDFYSSSSSSFTLETKNSLDSIAFWFIFDVLTNIAGDQASELLFESLKEKPGLVQVLREWSARLTVKEGQIGSMAILANMWNASEYFRKFYREQIMSGQVWCRPNLELLIQKIEQDQDFDPLLLFGIPTRTTKKTLISVGGGEKICLEEAPSSKMDQIKYLHKVHYVNTLVFFVDLPLFGTNMDVFITLFTKNDIEQKFKDSRIILLFTKPDLAKKKLEYGFQFSRFNGNEYKFDEKLEDITNEYMEQEAINFVLNQHLGYITERGIRVEYHILNVIERSEVECVIPYIVNPNPSNFHFISPSLKKNTLKERLLANLSSSKLSDVTIIILDEKND